MKTKCYIKVMKLLKLITDQGWGFTIRDEKGIRKQAAEIAKEIVDLINKDAEEEGNK